MILNQVLNIVMFSMLAAMLLLPFNKQSKENCCLDIQNMNVLKGLSCILVIVSHISLQLGSSGILVLTSSVGYLAVGIFFFSSGYGLMYSFINKENYLKNFIRHRILKILLPFWIANIIFLLVYIVGYKEHYALLDVIKYIFGIKLICGHAWFIVFLICFYCLFWIFGKVLKKDDYIIIAMAIFTLLISVLIGFQIIKYGDFGKNILAFPIGMISARYKGETRKLIDRRFWRISLLSTIIFCITYSYYTVIKWHIGMANDLLVNYFVDFICQISFIIMLLMFVQKINVKSKVTLLVSGISYEVYLVHQLGLDFAKSMLRNSYDAFIIVTGIILSILIGLVFNKVMKKIWSIQNVNR